MCSTLLKFKAVLKTKNCSLKLQDRSSGPCIFTQECSPFRASTERNTEFCRAKGKGVGFDVDGLIMLIDH